MRTLFLNGKIASLNSSDTFYEALGICDSTIDFLGSNAEAEKIIQNYDKVIQLDGKVMLPGFIDSHMHLLNYGYTLRKLDLCVFDSIEDMISVSKKFIIENNFTNEKWLLGRGWNQDKLKDQRFVTRYDLDKISTEVPIVFTRVCGHISVCNTAAINRIGLENIHENDPNININEGIFQEDGLNILYNSIPSPDVNEIKSMISESCTHLIKSGITSVQTDDLCSMPDQDYKKVLKAYNDLNLESKLPVRVYQQCLFFDKDSFEDFANSGYRTGQGDNFFKIGPLKLLLDGSLGARTALLQDDYSDCAGNKGIVSFSQEELDDFFDASQKYNFQVAAHAIGDKAMDMFIESVRKYGFQNGGDKRHGIVHAQITNSSIIQSMKELELVAYVQPIFLDYDLHIVDARVGARALESYAFKTMLDSGVKLCFGTDAPVVGFNPFENIYSAVVRKDLNGNPEEPYLPEERLSVTEALKLYTIDSAYSSFEESLKGSLELGKLADLVVIDRDIFTIDENEIKNITVEMTVIDGNIAYIK